MGTSLGIGQMTRVALALGLTMALGCAEMDGEGDVDSQDQAALSSSNGLTSLNGLISANGLISVNGLNSINGLTSVNGLNSLNGLNSVNGLSSINGLMTTDGGRATVGYIVRCALPASRTLVKNDQTGTPRSFKGQFGLAPEWETGACGTACQESVSACLMAHINAAGVHVPLWFDAPMPAIGFGLSSTYPNQEGTFFGNLFILGSDGKVPMFYCEGPGFAKGVVPGRLGGVEAAAFRNPWGDGGRCDQKCTAADAPNTGHGYKSCNGYTRPITVWRAASYRPEFDANYKYKLVNVSTKKAVDLWNWNTNEGGAVSQYSFTGQANQMFKVVKVADSTWKLVSVHSGKVLVGMGTAAGTAVAQKSYVDTNDHEWSIDDHNGHFKIRNKGSNNVLEVPAGSGDGTAARTGTWAGSLNQDWDIIGVP